MSLTLPEGPILHHLMDRPFPICRMRFWRYRYLEGLGQDVILPFADICNCGDYRLTEGGGSHYVPKGTFPGDVDTVIAPGNRGPQIRFKDLEEFVAHKIDAELIPFTVRTDFVKVTRFTVMVPVTVRVRNRDITFAKTGGVSGER